MDGLLLVGGGKMGGALLAGWLDRGIARNAVAVTEPDPDRAAALRNAHGITVVAHVTDLDPGWRPSVVVLAVKPQVMDQVAPDYARFARPDTVFLSIAAGTPIAYFQSVLGDAAAIVRAMPNTPAAIRHGITVACANDLATETQKAACQSLLEAVGEALWIEDEALMDAVTAVSGSGPAYVFLLAECLAQAGASVGLPADLAARLARVTVSGAGALLQAAPESAAELRANVTSPGGTTAAALAVLMADDGLAPLMRAAVDAATRRSRELAG